MWRNKWYDAIAQCGDDVWLRRLSGIEPTKHRGCGGGSCTPTGPCENVIRCRPLDFCKQSLYRTKHVPSGLPFHIVF